MKNVVVESLLFLFNFLILIFIYLVFEGMGILCDFKFWNFYEGCWGGVEYEDGRGRKVSWNLLELLLVEFWFDWLESFYFLGLESVRVWMWCSWFMIIVSEILKVRWGGLRWGGGMGLLWFVFVIRVKLFVYFIYYS